MVKVRKLVDITLDDKSSKVISTPMRKEKFKGEQFSQIALWIRENLKNELGGITERRFILTFKNEGIVGAYLVGIGDYRRVEVNNMEVLKLIIQDEADCIIDLHNHPVTGNVNISEIDIRALSESTAFYRNINVGYWMLICNKDVNIFNYYGSLETNVKYKIKISKTRLQSDKGNETAIPKYTVNKGYEPFILKTMRISIAEEKKKRVTRKGPETKQPVKKTETKTKRRVTPKKPVKE
jgi:hypothetical protein